MYVLYHPYPSILTFPIDYGLDYSSSYGGGGGGGYGNSYQSNTKKRDPVCYECKMNLYEEELDFHPCNCKYQVSLLSLY